MLGTGWAARTMRAAVILLALGASSIAQAALFVIEEPLALRWDQPRSGTHRRVSAGADLPTEREKPFIPGLDPIWAPGIQHSVDLDARSSLGIGGGAAVNRVDGLSILAREVIENRGAWVPSLLFYEGYGTESKEWSGAAELRMRPGARHVNIGARWADETSAFLHPRSILTAQESFAAASLLREDFFDYLNRRSRAAFITWTPSPGTGLELLRSQEEHHSLERVVSRYGPFGGHKRFRTNPAIEEGDWSLLRLRGSLSQSRRRRLEDDTPGRSISIEAQWAGGAIGRGGTFTRLWAEHRGGASLTPNQSVGYRVSGGFTPVGDRREDGSRLPAQWQFQAGGIGSLRGHKFQEFRGDRLGLATLEYSIDPGDAIKTVLFLDGGMAWNEANDVSGGIAGSGPLALDGGIGVALGTQGLRVDVARDLRKQRAPARVTARLSLPY